MLLGGTVRLNKPGTVILCVLLMIFGFYLFRNGRTLSEKNDQVDLRKLLIGSIEAAIMGGRQVVLVHNGTKFEVRSKGKTKEGINDPVTDADMFSHCAMYYSLKHTFPPVTVISEEKPHEGTCRTLQTLELDQNVLQFNYELPEQFVPASDITVWIDPLDATKEFTENLLQYVTTMVCVAVGGVPTLGVIHSPFTRSTTWAWLGKTKVNEHVEGPKKLTIITSLSHKGDVTEVINKVFGSNVDIVGAGGAGYKSLQVAAGNVSAYIHTTRIKKWDICAGDALLRALNGRMTTLIGEEISYSSNDDVVNEKGLIATLHNHSWFTRGLAKFYAEKT